MWHDGILSPVITTSSSSSNTAEAAAADGQLYTLKQNICVFAPKSLPCD
jgi:hypothetical protein